MADELELLTASFDADLSKFDSKLDKLVADFNDSSSKVEQRNASMIAKLNSQFGGLSLTKLAGAVGATALLDSLVESSKNLADQTLNVSKATGIAGDTLQGLGLIARKAGVDQDSLNTSLEFFGAQVGAAQLKQTSFGKAMAALGVDIKNGPQVALMSLSDQIGKLPVAQQDAIAKMSFGRGGVTNLSWLTDGSKNIQAMIDGFRQMGLIVPVDQLQKVEQIFEAWQDVKTEALVGFMEGFSSFAGDVSSPAFQGAMQNFGVIVGDIAGFVVKMAPYIPQLIELYAAFNAGKGGASIGGAIGSLAGPGGTAIGIGVGGLAGAAAGFFGAKAALTPDASAAAPPALSPKPTGSANLGGIFDTDAAAKQAAVIANLNKQLDQQIQETATKASDAAVDMAKAQNDAVTEMAKGTAAYYALNNQAIEQNAALDIQKTYEAEDAAIGAIADRSNAQIASAKADIKSADDLATEIAKIKTAAGVEETNTAAETASKVETINTKKNQALIANDWQYQQSLQNLIQLNQEISDGLTNVGVAGLTSFKAMGQAASEFLLQLAQLITKLYVMQPLMNSLLGPPGTTGGGLLGGLIGDVFGGSSDLTPLTVTPMASSVASVFGFKDGGVFVPGQGRMPLKRFAGGGTSNMAAIFGEAGPEAAVPLPDGRSIPVTLRIPQPVARAASSGPTIVQQFDLSGAVVTDDLYAQVQRTADSSAQKAVATYDRLALPQRVRTLTAHPRQLY